MYNQKRILHIMPGYGGGISSHVFNLVKGIDSEKIIIDIAGFTEYPISFKTEVENKGGKVFTLQNVRLKTIFQNIKEYNNILRENKYDMVHMHLTDFQATYFSILSRCNSIKRIISHAHIANQPRENSAFENIFIVFKQKLTCLVATGFVSCSKLASAFRFGTKKVKRNQVMHIPNSIDTAKYFFEFRDEERKKYKEDLKISFTSLVIGNVGYFGYQKNYPFMLEIIKCLKEKNIDFVWIMIGTGIDFESIVKLAKTLDIDDKIRFLGRRADIPQLFKLMDVSVLTSHFEGLPTVTIETQAAGTPTVISDTITEETDMGLGMVKRMSLYESPYRWGEAIMDYACINIPSDEQRLKILNRKCFTSKRAALLYEKYVNGEISHYNIGDEVNW